MPSTYVLKALTSLLQPRIALCFDANRINDGTGAQIQRIMAIYSLSKFLGLKYVHKPISEVSIHPLDSHRTTKQYKHYLFRLNSLVSFPSDLTQIQGYSQVEVPKLTSLGLMRLFMKSRTSSPILINIGDPYSIIDANPNIYNFARPIVLRNFNEIYELPKVDAKVIMVHYRSTPGAFATYPGESRPRQYDIERLRRVLERAIKISDVKSPYIKIFTDAPKSHMKVKVKEFQASHWRNTPGYRDGYLELSGLDLEHELSGIGSKIEVHVGGDPLEALAKMASANVLIMSKSSFSYVAHLLNADGTFFSPFEFWHPVRHSRRF